MTNENNICSVFRAQAAAAGAVVAPAEQQGEQDIPAEGSKSVSIQLHRREVW